MAKKSFIPTDALEATTLNITKAESAKSQPQPKKIEKDGDVGPIINVNLPVSVKVQLHEIKYALELKNEKRTVNSIIREAVYEYLDNHYNEIVGK